MATMKMKGMGRFQIEDRLRRDVASPNDYFGGEMTMREQKAQGFTLMELLIVIAIIAALAALIYAGLSWVRERGRMIGCISNLKQIYNALQMYEEDWGEFFYRKPSRDSLVELWREKQYPVECDLASALYPYTKNEDIFVCPKWYHIDFCVTYPIRWPKKEHRMAYHYNYAFARFKNFPITPNLVSHFCTYHANWHEKQIDDTLFIFRSPYLICLMDGSVHLHHSRNPLTHFEIVRLKRPFTHP